MTPAERVYFITSNIPKGRVTTYGFIALLARLKSPRIVGTALHKNKKWKQIPCHRVVNAAGRLAPAFGMGGARIHEARLRREGITFTRMGDGEKPGIVDLKRHRWMPTRAAIARLRAAMERA